MTGCPRNQFPAPFLTVHLEVRPVRHFNHDPAPTREVAKTGFSDLPGQKLPCGDNVFDRFGWFWRKNGQNGRKWLIPACQGKGRKWFLQKRRFRRFRVRKVSKTGVFDVFSSFSGSSAKLRTFGHIGRPKRAKVKNHFLSFCVKNHYPV